MKTALVMTSVMMLCGVAAADDKWHETVTFSSASATAMKVTEPEGYKVTVAVDGNVLSDSVPARFALPGDGYYQVTLIAPDGATVWTKKLEAKRYQTTEVRLVKEADAPAPAAAGSARKYIGTTRNRLASDCGRQYVRTTARFELLDANGATVVNLQATPGESVQSTVPAGTYDVRTYLWNAGKNEWLFLYTNNGIEFARDRWSLELACDKARGTVATHFTK